MTTNQIIRAIFEEEEVEKGSAFFNVSREHSLAYLGLGVACEGEPVSNFNTDCAEFIATLKRLRANENKIFLEDPVKEVDKMVAEEGEVVVTKLDNHPMARYMVTSRRKKVNFNDKQLTRLETIFKSLSPDDIVVWRMRVDHPGILAFAGVVFYGESDIKANDPSYDPSNRVTNQRRRLGRSHPLGEA